MWKKTIKTVYILLIVCMAVATIMGKQYGMEYTVSTVYGSWWFCLLWGILAFASIVYFLRSKVRRLSLILLHTSFIVILLGALITHLFAYQGFIHLRLGEATNKYWIQNGDDDIEERNLPFSIKLNDFRIDYHQGTNAPSDYVSQIEVMTNGIQKEAAISMNNIYEYQSVRLYQSSYDEDGKGSYLTVNIDPLGISVTYIGYALLFFSLIWILFDPKGAYRQLLRHPLLKKGMLFLFLFIGFGTTIRAVNSLSKDEASRFCELNILYNNRICPLQTYAIDFTKKLYHKSSYKQYSAEQVLTGFLFYGSTWDDEPIIRIKNATMRNRFSLPKYTSLRSFFQDKNYILGTTLQEYYQGNQDSFHKAVVDIDSKLQLILSLRKGTPLYIYPYTIEGKTAWYATDNDFPAEISDTDRFLMKHLLMVFKEDVAVGNTTHFLELLDKVMEFQSEHGGASLPSASKIRAERIYNAIPFSTVLFMLNLTMGFLTLFYGMYRLTRINQTTIHLDKVVSFISWIVLFFSFLALSVCEILRWKISGEIPMKNGYETMLLLAWFVMFIALMAYKRFFILLTFGFLLSGFFLLVAYISQMDPQITPMMPVLASPLLSIHVSIIMMSYALLSLTFFCGIMALLLRMIEGHRHLSLSYQLESLQLLSKLFVYPAISLLGIGIFIGAIWANVSWGRYWGWDPKEVWALITFMVYAVVLHTSSIPKLKKPMNYHLFMVVAFLTVLMTYFGVNYLLGGMHSYANA